MDANRILIVKMSSIGDIILSLPMLKALRTRYPRAHIAWIVEDRFKDVLEGNPDIDELIVYEKKGLLDVVVNAVLIVKRIRAGRFDVAIDIQGWLKSNFFTLLSGAKHTIGLDTVNELGFHVVREKVKVGHDMHMADRFLKVASAIGAEMHEPVFEFRIPPGESEYVRRFLEGEGITGKYRFVIISPGTTRQNKTWKLGNYSIVCDSLIGKHGLKVVIVWGPGEREQAVEIAGKMREHAIIAPPTSIKQLAALIEESDLLICPDCGPMHLAVALGTPTVTLFGPTNPKEWGPYRGTNIVLRGEGYSIDAISSQEVVDAAKRVLGGV